ncbi:MAG: cytochrome P450 [Candidatus Limnocylindria bacterium]
MTDHPPDDEIPFDPLDPRFIADPYPAYDRVRAWSGAWRRDGDPLWYLTRHADVHAAFRDRRLGVTFTHRHTPEALGLPPGIPVWRDPRWQEFAAFERWELLNVEPPVHTRLRRLVTEAFTPRTIEGLRGGIVERARALLAPGREAGSIDLVDDYAQPFSLGIICDLIGVAAEDRLRIRHWSDEVVAMYEPAPCEAQRAASDSAAGEFRRYLLDVVAERRRRPAGDLLSALLDATVDGERLTDDQVVSTAMVLLMAGHEATVNATANGIALLAADPDQWRRLRAGEVGARTAIEEILRFDPPLQWFGRWVLEPGVVIDGIEIPVGSRVALVLAAANRDPRRWPEPARFEIARGDTGHLSFGGGIHFCIGAPLARLELETTLTELIRSEAAIELDGPPVRRRTFQFRGFEHLRIRVRPSA